MRRHIANRWLSLHRHIVAIGHGYRCWTGRRCCFDTDRHATPGRRLQRQQDHQKVCKTAMDEGAGHSDGSARKVIRMVRQMAQVVWCNRRQGRGCAARLTREPTSTSCTLCYECIGSSCDERGSRAAQDHYAHHGRACERRRNGDVVGHSEAVDRMLISLSTSLSDRVRRHPAPATHPGAARRSSAPPVAATTGSSSAPRAANPETAG